MNKARINAIREGYSFLGIGQLSQTIIDINTEACRRFGAVMAGNVVSIALCDARKSMEYIVTEIKEETGISASTSDLVFLGKIVRAQQLINEAIKLLQEA